MVESFIGALDQEGLRMLKIESTDTRPSIANVNFAQGLKKDLAAVKAGLTLAWNNGPADQSLYTAHPPFS